MKKPKLITTIDFLRNNISSSITPDNLKVCEDMVEHYLCERFTELGNANLNEHIADIANALLAEISNRLTFIQKTYK